MIQRQIEKLQNIVNNLLGLCATSSDEAVAPHDDLSPEESRHERLGIMLLKAQDGVLEDRYMMRMEKWILCDEAALRYYVDFQNLTALLHTYFKPNRFSPDQIFGKTLTN